MPIELVGAGGITTPGMESAAMPTVAGDAVVESGSNSDGEWVKWGDGTQHVAKRVSTDLLVGSTSGNILVSDVQSAEIMAAAFVGIHHVSITLDADGGNASVRWIVAESTTDLSLTAWPSYRVADSISSTGVTDVHFFATGRWK